MENMHVPSHTSLWSTMLLVLIVCGYTGAAQFRSSSISSSSPPSSSSLLPPSLAQVPYSRHEGIEQHRAWKQICRSCAGSWSGALAVYQVEDSSVRRTTTNPLNFRLQVRPSKKTWTVWNLQRPGDETVVPLRPVPAERPSQYKIGFASGIILRVPSALTTELPRLVWEIGFWTRPTRRTLVAEYTANAAAASGADNTLHQIKELDEITLVQMERQKNRGFVGNTTVEEHIAYLPESTSSSSSPPLAAIMKEWQWRKSEQVDLQTWQRRRIREDGVQSRVAAAFESDIGRFVMMLPNCIAVSMPHQVVLATTTTCTPNDNNKDDSGDTTLMFAHQWSPNHLSVLEVKYEGKLAHSATEHTYVRGSAKRMGWLWR